MSKRSIPPSFSLTDPPEMNPLKSQRTDRVAQITNPRTQFQEASFVNLLGSQKARLDSLLTGPSMSQFYPFNNNNILESFRIQQNRPGFESTIPNSELSANYTHPVMRVVKPYTDAVDAVSKHEIALEYKDDPYNMDTVRTRAGHMQSNPQTVVAPAIYNNIIYNQQVYDAQQDYDEYLEKGPWDYWENWGVGGIVEFEEMLDGSEATLTSGLNSGSNSQRAAGYKLCTITAKGPQFCYNYFGSNIRPAAKCYAIIKKHQTPTHFNLSSNFNAASALGLNSINHAVDTPIINNLARGIRPYQMSFVCLPSGGMLPPEATKYYDERGELRRDGLVIYLGKVWSTPINHEYRSINNYYDIAPFQTRTPHSAGTEYNEKYDRTSFNDAQSIVDREAIMHMKLIMDPDDGLAP